MPVTAGAWAPADELGRWLDENWNPNLRAGEWWARLAEARWSTPDWPERWGGRGLDLAAAAALRSVYEAHDALVPPSGFGRTMMAPTLLQHGSDDQCAKFLPGIQEGSVAWCQLFSEPDAGSDLASLKTTATLDRDTWVIHGQKIWSSQAAQSDMGMLLARTEPDTPRHGGISFLVIPMDQPGVEVRPLREMTGRSLFNEVFLDGARAAEADVIGGRGNGWNVAQTLLQHERASMIAGANPPVGRFPGPKGGMIDRRAGDVVADVEPDRASTLTVDEVRRLAASVGRHLDPHAREEIARLVALDRVLDWTNARLAETGGSGAGAAGLSRVASTALVKRLANTALALLGPAGLVAGADGPEAGRYAHAFLFSAASSIYGGTDEIQRNILAERVLGLPR